MRKLLLGLLLIAPGLQASEATPKTEEEIKEQASSYAKAPADKADEIAQELERRQASQEEYTETFIAAVNSKNVALAKKIIAKVDMKKFNALTPHPLFEVWNPKVVELLIPHVDINMKDSREERTLLGFYCHVAGFGFTSARPCVNLVLEHRPDINAIDDKEDTALRCLLIEPAKFSIEHIPIFQTLLSHNADAYIKDRDGKTIPHYIHEKINQWEGKKDLAHTAIVLCIDSRTKDLHAALAKHVKSKDVAGIIIDYTWEDYEREALEASKKTDSTTLTKTGE